MRAASAAICALQFVLYALLGGAFDCAQFLRRLPTLVSLFVLGPLSLEFGWRGFLQVRLERALGPLVASLGVGVVWALWHLPLFYMKGTSQHELGLPFLPFLIVVTSSSLIYAFVLRSAEGSLFSAIFFHWVNTYLLQVVATTMVRGGAYDRLEFLPTLLVGAVFAAFLARKRPAEAA